MLQSGDAVAVRDRGVGSGVDQELDDLLVRRSAVPEHDGFQQRGPAEPIDVVDRHVGLQQGWDTTIGQIGVTGGVWTNFLGGGQGVASGAGTAEEWFGGILGDLEAIWPGTQAAFSGQAARMHWPTFPYALGSYTCYRPGQWAYWSYEGAREGNIHFCGEHCSLDFQGWLEGAVESGQRAANEVVRSL